MNLEDNQTASLTKTIDRIYEDKKMENQNISHTFLHTSNDKGLTSSDVKPIDKNNEEITTKTDGACSNYNCTSTSNESTGEQRSVTPILVKQNAITGKCPSTARGILLELGDGISVLFPPWIIFSSSLLESGCECLDRQMK